MDGGIKLYGTLWCSDCKRSKKFFAARLDLSASAAGEGAAAALAIRRYVAPLAGGMPTAEPAEGTA